jgi:Sec-independent protein secretion pathway component TatC
MVTWSSILEYYRLHRGEVRRYLFAVLFIFGALYTGRNGAAILGFLAIPVLYAYNRWGEPWRLRGEQMMNSKRKS